jgi:hypothetical protein
MKRCKVCDKEKDLGCYYKQYKTRKDGSKYIYHNPECKECTKERSTKWLRSNKERRKILNHRYSVSDKGKAHFYKYQIQYRKDGRRKEWEQNNKDKLRGYRMKRSEEKAHEISNDEWENCKMYFSNSCAYCGMSEEEHKKIQNQQLHKEHVDPDGENDLSNCIPACRPCNSGKHYSEFKDWYNEHNDKFSKVRFEKIHTWLNEDYKIFIEKKEEVSQ